MYYSTVCLLYTYIHSGYQCEEYDNPADFFLDVIIENEEADGPEGTTLHVCVFIN